jgi:pyruvate kinase
MSPINSFKRKTKIVATLGPATSGSPMLKRLARAGMDIARLNLSFGTLEDHAAVIKTIRELNGGLNKEIGVLVDLPGPKYRVGRIKGGQTELKKGTIVTFTTENIEGDSKKLPVNLPNLARDSQPGDTILLADGELRCRVEKISGPDIECRIIVGGIIKTGKGIVVPGRRISGPYLTPSMRDDILFAAEHRPDFLAMSFISSADEIEQVKNLLAERHVSIPLISKIERAEAVPNFDRILAASDGIMVARGDLGVEVPLEKVPIIQKEVIRKCNRAGKPVITATEMLESMVRSPRPTRAETTDVANAILDGTDAVMLSAETSVGSYPVETVKMMSRIAREAEKILPYGRMLETRGQEVEAQTDELISYNAWLTAHRLKASAIIAYTQSGITAKRVSRFRPDVPILALTPSDEVYRGLTIYWGVFPLKTEMPSSADDIFTAASRLAKERGLAKTGELIVVTAGIPMGQPGSTNMLKVERVSD